MIKVGEDQEVRALFAGSQQQAAPVDVSVKKFVYKLIGEANASGSGKVAVAAIWQKYFALDDAQQRNASTGKAHLNSKDELVKVLEHMETDDLCMLDGDDVILTGQ